MAVATATASGGLVRIRRRAWTTSRGCWRLVVLLGLAWAGLLLLGGTAQAASPDREPGPAGPIPLLGQALSNAGTLTATLPLDEVATHVASSQPAALLHPVSDVVATATATATATVANATSAVAKAASAAAAAAPAYLPAADGLQAAQDLADSVQATATATASGQKLLDVQVPSIAAVAGPVVDAAADQVDTTVQLAAAAAGALVAPVPVARPLAGVLVPVVGAVGVLTDVATASGSTIAGAVDSLVGAGAGALAPVLAVVSAPAGSIAVTGGASAGGTGGTPVAAPDPHTVVPGTEAWTAAHPADGVVGADSACPDSTRGGPAVPPPDAGTDSIHVVAQPAPDIATVLPVPVSGAGSTTGNGGPAPTPAVDPTLVRVESDPDFSAGSTDPIEGPTGPMPGTPAADPAFSPD